MLFFLVACFGNDKSISGEFYSAMLIPAGTFTMGCTEGDSDCIDHEKPLHKVTISKDFYLMKSEVTQELYESVIRSNPSTVKGLKLPVESVSWFDAVTFANKLSKLEGLEECYQINGKDVQWSNKDCKGWRLPTAAEWEYAARGGQDFKYAGSNLLDDVAWYESNSEGQIHPVGQKKPNGFGLYDMSGNVWEWVWEWSEDYSTESQLDPTGPSTGSIRVIRGGGWDGVPRILRVSFRVGSGPADRNVSLGFRLGRSL